MASFRKNGNGIFGTGFDTGDEQQIQIEQKAYESDVPEREEFLEGVSEATGEAKEKSVHKQKLYQYHFYPDISISYQHY